MLRSKALGIAQGVFRGDDEVGDSWVLRGVMALRVAVGVSKGFCIKIY